MSYDIKKYSSYKKNRNDLGVEDQVGRGCQRCFDSSAVSERSCFGPRSNHQGCDINQQDLSIHLSIYRQR
jgi:hypothetical protein